MMKAKRIIRESNKAPNEADSLMVIDKYHRCIETPTTMGLDLISLD